MNFAIVVLVLVGLVTGIAIVAVHNEQPQCVIRADHCVSQGDQDVCQLICVRSRSGNNDESAADIKP